MELQLIFNIQDRRQNKYRWKKITAMIEPIWNENYRSEKSNGDIHKATDEQDAASGIGYHEIPTCSLAMAIEAANELPYPCVLFIYDHGKGINVERHVWPNLKQSEPASLRQ